MIDINEFRRNQSRLPPAEREKYNGQYVAWSADGSRILAADADPLRLDALLRAAGYDPAEILVSRLVVPEEVSWSGWCPAEGSDSRTRSQPYWSRSDSLPLRSGATAH